MSQELLLAIDQGTTSSRAIIFDTQGNKVCSAQEEFKQYYPDNGWVEHDPEEIYSSVIHTCRSAIQQLQQPIDAIKAIGISNQRETTIVWNKHSGEAVYPAIVWQDRRTSEYCQQLAKEGLAQNIQNRTGLLIDPYFSATKIRWILDNVDGAEEAALAGDLLFGTIDTWLLWKLSGGRSHCTDATNASRTLLFNIHTQEWDADLLAIFNIPVSMLPEVKNSADRFGYCDKNILGASIPILALIGDQQAALIGQACFSKGMAKTTYGTGCFLMLNTGSEALKSDSQLLTTIAYRINNECSYAIEGSIFVAGAAVQWLRDGLKFISNAEESEKMARESAKDHGVYLVPAFTGLGAPYWDPDARGAILGLTRATSIEDIVTAGLESVCYQTKDLQKAMERDGVRPEILRVDGGMTNNDWLMQRLADILGAPIERPAFIETTALGAMYLCALQLGIYSSLNEIADQWEESHRFMPTLEKGERNKLYAGWQDAVERVKVKK